MIIYNLTIFIQVGEEKLVLNIGQKALQHPDSKPYVHDILLSMALAEVRQREKISQLYAVFYLGSVLCLGFLF